MIDAFVIGTKLTLDEKIFEQMDGLIESFTRMQAMVNRVNATLKETGSMARQAAGGVRELASAWEQVARATARAAGAADRMTAARPMSPPSPAEVMPGTPVLPGSRSRSMPLMMPPGGRVTGGDEPFHAPVPLGGGGGVYDRSRSNFRAGGGGGGDEMPPIPLGGGFGDGRRPKRGRKQHDWAEDIFIGGMIGGAATGAARAAWEAAAAPKHQEALLMTNGVSRKDVKRMAAEARRIQQTTPGIGYDQALTILRDSYSVTRSVPDAMAVAPTLARDAVILASRPGGADEINELFLALQSAEIHGELNKKSANGTLNLGPFSRYMNLATRLSVATGYRFSPGDIKQMSRNAGAAFKTMSDHAIIEAGVMSLDLGAGRVGTGLNAINQEFVGGRMSKAALEILQQMGIASKNPKLIRHTAMGRVQIAPGGIVDQKLLSKDPTEWAYKFLLPAIEKKYGKSDIDVQAGIQQVMARIPGASVVANMFNNRALIERYLLGMADVPGTGQLLKILEKNDPDLAIKQLKASMSGAASALFSPALKDLDAAIERLAGVLNGFANWADKHPGASYAAWGGVAAGGLTSLYFGGRALNTLRRKVFGFGEKAANTADEVAEDAIKDLRHTARRTAARNAFTEAVEGAEAGEGAGPWGVVLGAIVGEAMKPVLDKLGKDLHDWGADVGDAIGRAIGGKPVPVHVTNGQDLAAGVTQHQAKQAGRMPSGHNGPNFHLTPPAPGRPVTGAIAP